MDGGAARRGLTRTLEHTSASPQHWVPVHLCILVAFLPPEQEGFLEEKKKFGPFQAGF